MEDGRGAYLGQLNNGACTESRVLQEFCECLGNGGFSFFFHFSTLITALGQKPKKLHSGSIVMVKLSGLSRPEVSTLWVHKTHQKERRSKMKEMRGT